LAHVLNNIHILDIRVKQKAEVFLDRYFHGLFGGRIPVTPQECRRCSPCNFCQDCLGPGGCDRLQDHCWPPNKLSFGRWQRQLFVI